MPPKGQPLRRQPARGTRGAINDDDDSAQFLSAPSPKELLTVNDNEGQHIPVEVEHAGSFNTRPTDSKAIDPPQTEPPSSASTITDSSPPIRPPVQRLTSVLSRSTSTITPEFIGVDVSRMRPSLKFKPKSAVRRSKEEREAEERAEAERRAARQAVGGVLSTNDRGSYYGRGQGRGRGRGGYDDMNRWKNERFNLSHSASGHLGGATLREATAGRVRGRGGNHNGGGTGDGAGRAHSAPSDSTATTAGARFKREPKVKPEKDKDGDVVMGPSNSGSISKRTKVKRENQAPSYVSSGSELGSDGGKRKKKNIERINLISSDEEDDEVQDIFSENAKGKQRERTPYIPSNLLRPVRIQRQEHVERTVGVNTDASSLTSAKLRQRAKDHQDAGFSLFLNENDAGILTTTKAKGRRKPKDVEFVRNERKWKGVYQDEDIQDAPAKIKDEPKDDEEVMVMDTSVPNREREPMAMDEEDAGVPLHTAIERSLPQPGKTLKVTETLDESGRAFDDENLPRPSERRRRTVEFVGDKPALTAEESDEFFADVSEIFAAQANVQEEALTSAPATATKGHDPSSDSDMDNKANDIFRDDEEERYGYVFQLPPIIPSLRDASKKVISPKTEKKTKPKGSDQAPSSNPFNVHPKDDTTIKSDPDDLTRESAYPDAYIAGGLHSPGGQVGVLNIYNKGPMRAFWGGMTLEISKGESGDMVPQEMVLTDLTNTVTKVEDESRWEEKVSLGEKGWAMGQTQRGFVCVPDWGTLLS